MTAFSKRDTSISRYQSAAGSDGLRRSLAAGPFDNSSLMVAQRRAIHALFSEAGPQANLAPVGQLNNQGLTPNAASAPIVQRYSLQEGNVMLSEGNKFAVTDEDVRSRMFIADDVELPKLQHVTLARHGEQLNVAGVTLKQIIPTFESQAEMAKMQCGAYSEMVTGVKETDENEMAQPGRSLYVNKLFDVNGEYDGAWENHYAPVIVSDGNDRGTLETAVFIDHIWFGIYGKKTDQSFRYKTVVADVKLQLARNKIEPQQAQQLLDFLQTYAREGREAESLRPAPPQVLEEIRQIEAALQSHAEPGEKRTRTTELPSVKEARLKREVEERDELQNQLIQAIRSDSGSWRDEVRLAHKYSLNSKINEVLKKEKLSEAERTRLEEVRTMTQEVSAQSGDTRVERPRQGPTLLQIIGGVTVLAILAGLLYLASKTKK